jgi:hypothetical protein
VLKFRKSQVDEIAAPRKARFVEEMRPILRERHPELTGLMTEEDLISVIEHGMRAAHGYGIKTVADTERYIHLMFLAGFDFDTSLPWARHILTRPDFTGDMRIDLLYSIHEDRIPERPEDGPFFP